MEGIISEDRLRIFRNLNISMRSHCLVWFNRPRVLLQNN